MAIATRGGQAEERDVGVGICVPDPVDRAGLRGALVSRLAGLDTPNANDAAGSAGRNPNGAGTTMPNRPILAAKAEGTHVSHPIDMHVGGRVRLRRQLLGMSQKTLAGELGITFQQVQKFERGANRIAAGRLHSLSRALDVPVSFFFDDLPPGSDGWAMTPRYLLPAGAGNDFMEKAADRREALALVRAYGAVPDPALRKRIFDLIRSLGHAQ